MKNAEQPSEPGRRRRKLLFGVAAFGLFLAVFVGFLLAPEGRRDDSVRIQLLRLQTNAPDHVVVWLSVTNVGKKGVAWIILDSEIKTNGQWVQYCQLDMAVQPFSRGRSGEISVRVPHDSQVWRWKVEWMHELTRFQSYRFKLKAKADLIFPGSKPDSYSWLGSYRRTNYSEEFPRPLPKAGGD